MTVKWEPGNINKLIQNVLEVKAQFPELVIGGDQISGNIAAARKMLNDAIHYLTEAHKTAIYEQDLALERLLLHEAEAEENCACKCTKE
jgi:hypothetical protein